jgi:hypothetical protein
MNPKKRKPLPPACPKCNWTGRIPVTINSVEAMAWCSCARGVWRSQMERARINKP